MENAQVDSENKTARHPVTEVSWQDAASFCNALSRLVGITPSYDESSWSFDPRNDGFRLPTEAEWEYAARAGTTTNWFWGDNARDADQYAWYSANSDYQTHPVGEKQPNPWDLFDMAGNVWEWTEDGWHDNYQGAPTDGRAWGEEDAGDCGGRVVRGGSWLFNPGDLRSADRGRDATDSRDFGVGFGVVCRPPSAVDR
jgi:formylglycine-generating enzyme required for sulfatase activity